MRERLTTTLLGDIVATDSRAAEVFERFGIDFCCGGRRTLDDACRSAAVDSEEVRRELEALPPVVTPDSDVTNWPIGRLIDYIVTTHHAYVRASLPVINSHLRKLVDAHGERHPELSRVAQLFENITRELSQHLRKEEQVLFPYVRELAMTADCGRHFRSPFGTVENPIRMMEREHREAADDLRGIREATRGFVTPEDGCPTYAACMAELEQFERDLHSHVHLENNVLFPKAVALEHGYHTS